MTDEQQQPEMRWAPIEPKPKNRGRVWLIIGLVVAALVIVAVLLFFLLPRADSAGPDETASPMPSASATATPADPSDDPTTPPVTTAPEPVDPSLDDFRGQVGVWLEDGGRGLDIVTTSSGQEAVQVIETLQGDAQRLSDTQAPSPIADEWRDGVADYEQKLIELKTAASDETDVSGAVAEARASLQKLTELAGL